MLFNSLVFILLFLPLAVAGDWAFDRLVPGWRRGYLLAVSLVFYGSFDVRFVPLLLLSGGLNWSAGALYARTSRAWIIAAAIAADLLLLGFYKYLDFAAELLSALPHVDLPEPNLAFPLGISFFTFGHIAYLVDLRRGRTEPAGLLDYLLYIAFFPKVVAGPLVRPAEFVPQLRLASADAEQAARGALLFTAGLAKKVLLGDTLGSVVDPVFAAAGSGRVPGFGQAIEATLGYTFQLYFDFSGYSDMAMGTALLFGIALPLNFDAPYRSVSIQEFWRRWHITLSSFLRDYLYISFGGNRHGVPRQIGALFLTMALGGLWHGAGLTFLAWGMAHGVALGLDLLWRKAGLRMPDWLGFALTFVFVVAAWVPFRATSLAGAATMFRGLAGQGGLGELTAGPILLVAAAAAILGPTAVALVDRLPPSRWVAVGAALLLAGVLLRVGNDSNAEFIYAKF